MSESANEIIDQIFITLALRNMPLRVITHSNVQKCRNMYVYNGHKKQHQEKTPDTSLQMTGNLSVMKILQVKE